ncbi:MAG: tRNA dihydrouridine synthase DusB [Clostridia bacterium]|nr:tRNA dihydrouridine synthase DusB [Clostridia bacterium]
MSADAARRALSPVPALWLGPMAGFSDRALRVLCRRFGADATVTEMISAKAVCYADRKTAALARIRPDETPCALQLFSAEPDVLAEAIRRLDAGFADGCAPLSYDLNVGCPMRKVTANGEGGALMRSPRLIERLVAAAVSATSRPVSVKMRAGWDDASKNAPDCARAAEAGGASLITVHGRTVRQLYGGEVDRAIIGAVKAAVSLPVIGNGDIRSAADARAMLDETGCDGVMVARAAIGRPYLFGELRDLVDGTRLYVPPTPAQIVACALTQLSLAAEEKGERRAVPEVRKQIAAYVSGFRGAADVRRRVNAAVTCDEVRALLDDFLAGLS